VKVAEAVTVTALAQAGPLASSNAVTRAAVVHAPTGYTANARVSLVVSVYS